MENAKISQHEPATMTRTGQPAYVYKGWKAYFVCPSCGRGVWQHLNFLGRRSLSCNGSKITKVREVPA